MTVLVVDDDDVIRRCVVRIVKRLGFEVAEANDGERAIALAERAAPAYAIVDFQMPTSGVSVVRRLRELYGDAVWILVLSGQDDEDMRAASFDAGADAVMAKPFGLVELRDQLLAATALR